MKKSVVVTSVAGMELGLRVFIDTDAMIKELCHRAITNASFSTRSASREHYGASLDKDSRAKLRAWRRLNAKQRKDIGIDDIELISINEEH